MHTFIRTFVIAALVLTTVGPAFAADKTKKAKKQAKGFLTYNLSQASSLLLIINSFDPKLR